VSGSREKDRRRRSRGAATDDPDVERPQIACDPSK
jgi:hypothetical protein